MSRIIKTESAGKQRTQLTRAIAVALRHLAAQTEFDDEARDLAAFIALALKAIHDGIDPSVAAWEKRGYWVKADRFRMEWAWAGQISGQMATAVLEGDWAAVARLSMQTVQKLDGVQVSGSPRVGKPWLGSFQRLSADA